MKLTLLVLTLALVWAAVTDGFNLPNMLFGAAIGLLAVFVLRHEFARPRLLARGRRIVSLGLLFVWELMVSAVRVAMIVVQPNLRAQLKPAIVAFPLTVQSDAEITLLVNMITLTPGTLSVDVSDDRSALYVHVLNLEDREGLIADIAGGFERRIREVYA